MEPNKEEKQTLSGGVSVAKILTILAITTVVVAVVFWGISLGREYQASSIEKKLAAVQEETEGMGDVDAKAKQILNAEENISQLNSAKNYWSLLLTELANQTTKNVTLTELTSDEEGRMTIAGSTVSYEALAKFMAALRDSGKFDEVVLGSATLAAGGGPTPISLNIMVTPSAEALAKETINKEE
ncbi:PilN domain-containing protein [Patescibacteria group bacterium]|nr:PilN domain-containing protein [Patescibacteria group bacterium]